MKRIARKKKSIFAVGLVITLLIGAMCNYSYAETMVSMPTKLEEKCTPEVVEALNSLEEGENLKVYIFLYDVNSEEVLNRMKEQFPDAYDEYVFAKEGDVTESFRQPIESSMELKDKIEEREFVDPVNDNLIQCAIEHKREIYRELYNELNTSFLKDYFTDEDDILFYSEYSPMIIANVDRNLIESICQDERLNGIELYHDMSAYPEMLYANQTTNVTYVRDTLGNKGSGVKIGILEANYEVPNTSYSELTSANITVYSSTGNTVTNHATCVATAIVGSTRGAAPQASVYCIGTNSMGNSGFFFAPIEWLLTQGVNIINYSGAINTFLGNNMSTGTYDVVCKWIDHIAINHDVHYIQSAGNTGNTSNPMITCPGMAYNAITIGGYNTANSTNPNNYSMYGFSSYEEASSGNRPEKPNLVAPAAVSSSTSLNYGTIQVDFGTSASSAQVAGVVAQLCGQASALKTKQTAIGAILEASSYLKIQGSAGAGVRGDDFASSVAITSQIGEKEGAGKLDARAARNVVSLGNYWGLYVSSSSFPYTKNVYINSDSNSLMRVSIFWLMRNFMSTNSGSHASNYTSFTSEGYFDDLELKVYDPSGNLVGSSTASKSNYEIVQFVPHSTGYYTIEISIYGTAQNSVESLGIAVW